MQQTPQPLGIGRRQRAQFVVAVQEVEDGTLGDGHAASGEFLVDLRDAAVFGVAQPSDQGEDVQAELVVRQREVRLRLGAIGPAVAAAGRVVAAADLDRQAGDGVQGGDSAEVGVVGAEPALADRAVRQDGRERLRAGRAWTGSGTHGDPPRGCSYLHYTHLNESPVKFAILEKNKLRKFPQPIPQRRGPEPAARQEPAAG